MAKPNPVPWGRSVLYDRIIEAAFRCIRRKRGKFYGLTLTKAEVSREAKVAQGSINYYFGTVEGMVAAVIHEGKQAGLADVETYAVLIGGEGDLASAFTHWSQEK